MLYISFKSLTVQILANILGNTSNLEIFIMRAIVKSLFQAIDRGDVEEVRKLVKADPSILNEFDDESTGPENGNYPIHSAARKNKIAVVKLLLDLGDNVNRQKASGPTALHAAAAYGFVDLVDLLIKRGADVNLFTKGGNASPLMFAAQQNHIEIIRRLLAAGAKIEQKDSTGDTAISIAQKKAAKDEKYKPMVELLGVHYIYKILKDYREQYNGSNSVIPELLKDLTEYAKLMKSDASRANPEYLAKAKGVFATHKETTQMIMERYRKIANTLADEYILDKAQAATVKAICKSQEAELAPDIDKMDKAIETTESLIKYQFEYMQRNNRAVLAQLSPSNAQQAYTDAQKRQAQASAATGHTTVPRNASVKTMA